MNQMPTDWLDELKREYPKRSGPMRWPRVFLAVRRALLESSWESIMEGVKRYAMYAKASGKEGSDFIATPENFFKDEIYLEELAYEAPKSKKDLEQLERRRGEDERLHRANDEAMALGLRQHLGEPVAAYETRIMLEKQKPARLRIAK